MFGASNFYVGGVLKNRNKAIFQLLSLILEKEFCVSVSMARRKGIGILRLSFCRTMIIGNGTF